MPHLEGSQTLGCACPSCSSPTCLSLSSPLRQFLFSFQLAAYTPPRSSRRLYSFLKEKINRSAFRLYYITSLLHIMTVLSPRFSIMAVFAEGRSLECVKPEAPEASVFLFSRCRVSLKVGGWAHLVSCSGDSKFWFLWGELWRMVAAQESRGQVERVFMSKGPGFR